MKVGAIVILAVALLASIANAASADGFLKAEGTRLLLDGKEYRAIGVNMPILHSGYNGTWFHTEQIYGSPENARQATIDGVVDAADNKLAFIRFFAGPGYPIDAEKLYIPDPDEYWRLMDEVFDLCRKHNVKLVPCLGVIGMWSTYYGEPAQALLDPESRSYGATRKYVREFVSRYKDDTNVLMWELANEIFHRADLNVEGWGGRPRSTFPKDSTAHKEKLTLEDSLTTDMLIAACTDITNFIKGIDSNHPVTTGDAAPRHCSVSLRENFPKTVWKIDTVRQHLSSLLLQQGEPLDVISLHANGGSFTSKTKVGNLPSMDYHRSLIQAAHASLTPVFIGEFSQGNPFFKDDPEAKWACAAIDMIEAEGVALTAIWVWHFPWQDKNWNIPNGASQPVLMKRVADFNRKYAGLE